MTSRQVDQSGLKTGWYGADARSRWRFGSSRTIEALALPGILLIAWWAISAVAHNIYFPPLSKILAALFEWLPGAFTTDIRSSLTNLLIGYFVAVILAVLLGYLAGTVEPIYFLISPLIEFLRGLPPPALLPIFLLALGFGDMMRISVIAWTVIWPVLISTIDGVRRVPVSYLQAARVFQLGPIRRVVAVVVPAASPYIFSGMRTGLGIGLIMIVVSELSAATDGIGHFILVSANSFAIPESWAGTIAMGLLGFALSSLFAFCERRALRWQAA